MGNALGSNGIQTSLGATFRPPRRSSTDEYRNIPDAIVQDLQAKLATVLYLVDANGGSVKPMAASPSAPLQGDRPRGSQGRGSERRPAMGGRAAPPASAAQ